MTGHDLELSAPSTWPQDEHAFCGCGRLMRRDDAGRLVCDDCETAADDAAVIVAEVMS
ncbi:hypothetical protein ACWT_5856 [Actinoplanes sp. SE50]|nr:hypothetical protein ACPL_5987 [Actinoplanes sp. SE50/110]ATO85271.1 hypothetical protein ACWT_5856 [Actinoplanes sp. SE50]SLM02681.1 hypothetical protein ACSP50_5963 [Actinoplanes sp. SE50/110]